MSAADFLPTDRGLEDLRRAAGACRGCELYADATQTVFGEGPRRARLLLVGEQPGDVEDREGEPFVGPAGALLTRCLDELGVSREEVYVTNAVKHFRFTVRGKRRIHEKPSLSHLIACNPWLEAELEAVQPALTVCLGATATRAVLGRNHSVTKERGSLQEGPEGRRVLVTTHPSAVLRAPDRAAAYQALKEDLAVAVDAVRPESRDRG